MDNKMRIAHISDLHISTFFKKNNIIKVQKAFEDILSKDVDHIVVSGDIADNAELKELLVFRNMLNKLDLLDTRKMTVIIGNHDIFGGVQTAEDVINFPSRCMNKNYENSVRRFVNHFSELYEDIDYLLPHSSFPFVKLLGNFGIVGINSVDRYSKLFNPFASNGFVSKEQTVALNEKLLHEKYRNKNLFVAIHHHFYKGSEVSTSSSNKIWDNVENFTMKLRKKKKLIKMFSDMNIKLVLHGHSHEMKEYVRKGITFLNAGAAIDNKTNLVFYYLVDFNDEYINYNLTTVEIDNNYLIPEPTAHELVEGVQGEALDKVQVFE